MQQPATGEESDPEDDDYKPAPESDDGEARGEKTEGKAKKKRASDKDALPRRRRGGIKLSDEEDEALSDEDGSKRRKENEAEAAERKVAAEAKAKAAEDKKVDDIFEQMKRESLQPAAAAIASPVAVKEFVTVKQTLEFAGESITVEKKVAAETLQAVKPAPPSKMPALLQKAAAKPKPKGDLSRMHLGIKRLICELLATLGGPKKISSIEKSSLDWQKYKAKEGIEDELSQHQKSGGYLGQQAFLQRADYRQFEIERDARNKARKPPPTGGAGL